MSLNLYYTGNKKIALSIKTPEIYARMEDDQIDMYYDISTSWEGGEFERSHRNRLIFSSQDGTFFDVSANKNDEYKLFVCSPTVTVSSQNQFNGGRFFGDVLSMAQSTEGAEYLELDSDGNVMVTFPATPDWVYKAKKITISIAPKHRPSN